MIIINESHPVDFVPHEHFDEVVPGAVRLQLVEPVVQLGESLPSRHIVHCNRDCRQTRALVSHTHTFYFHNGKVL